MESAEVRRHWAAALRSNRYTQGVNQLRDGDCFCCLGVLCDLYDPDNWDGNEFDTEAELPPAPIMQWAGISLSQAKELSELNDLGETFATIATIIEDESWSAG